MDNKISDAVKKLLSAARNNHPDIAERMLKRGADVNAKDQYGSSALKSAARNGWIEVLRVLLAANADTASCDEAGTTALIGAAYRGRT